MANRNHASLKLYSVFVYVGVPHHKVLHFRTHDRLPMSISLSGAIMASFPFQMVTCFCNWVLLKAVNNPFGLLSRDEVPILVKKLTYLIPTCDLVRKREEVKMEGRGLVSAHSVRGLGARAWETSLEARRQREGQGTFGEASRRQAGGDGWELHWRRKRGPLSSCVMMRFQSGGGSTTAGLKKDLWEFGIRRSRRLLALRACRAELPELLQCYTRCQFSSQ